MDRSSLDNRFRMDRSAGTPLGCTLAFGGTLPGFLNLSLDRIKLSPECIKLELLGLPTKYEVYGVLRGILLG